MANPALGFQADSVILGPEATVVLFEPLLPGVSLQFSVVEGTVREEADVPDKSDTGSYPYKRSAASGLQILKMDITAQRTTTLSPHSDVDGNGGCGINAADFLVVQVWPYGISNADFPNYFYEASLVLSNWESSFRVRGSEPQTIKFSGQSDGPYTKPI